MAEIEPEIELFDPDSEFDSDLTIKEYDIVSSPNDFNVLSYYNFIESGAIVIPGFQRHFVWDIRKASKLIESILMGLPIPQIFLYEKAKNKFLVIDGQQRLMTLYYFIKGRFPKRAARATIRSIFSEKGKLEDVDLENDELFSGFRLTFGPDGAKNPYAGLTYAGLEDLKPTFDLRTIRNIMVKQVRPDSNHSSVFELFSRLNSGGMNLSSQEIRMSLYYGDFVRNAVKWNEIDPWRVVMGRSPDPRQKDVEVILRLFAMAANYSEFKKPLSKFINDYCGEIKTFDDPNGLYIGVFTAFCEMLAAMDRGLYLEPRSKRISVPILESLFVVFAKQALDDEDVMKVHNISEEAIKALRDHDDFEEYFTGKTTDADAVKGRIGLALATL